MIFCARRWAEVGWLSPERAAASLGLFAGKSAPLEKFGDTFLASLELSSGVTGKTWRAPRSPSGWPVLLHGWIDNLAELQSELGLPGASAATVYGAAVERWGPGADRHVIGKYGAIVAMPDGSLRLSRSPWQSFHLFVYRDADVFIASTLPRPIFAAGVAKRLRIDAVVQMLAMEAFSDTEAVFEGLVSVPHGAVMTVTRDGAAIDRWYDPLDIPEVSLASDDDYVEAANAVLADAVAAALRGFSKPSISLSGGLDSPIVADEVLRQLPAGQKLPSFTFRPHPDWDGIVAPGGFGDDWPWVEQFARDHPALEAHPVEELDRTFDDRAEELFLATDFAHPTRVLASVYHGVLAAARDHGCDVMLGADLGNMTYSSNAPWAYGEFLRERRWGELAALLRGRADPRHPLRKFIAECVAPALPGPLQAIYRDVLSAVRGGDGLAYPFFAAGSPLAAKRKARNIASYNGVVELGKSRAEIIRREYYLKGLGQGVGLGLDLVFGIPSRDVTAYRPLIEFCNAIPTDQYVRGGERRYLARRMAKGRMPEAQRVNTLYGQHHADWHARMTPRLADWRAEVARIAAHPDLGPLLDTDAMMAKLDAWPTQTPRDQYLTDDLRFSIPAAIYMRRYVDAMTGRNAC